MRFLSLCICIFMACAPSPQTVENAKLVSDYGIELSACLATADTKTAWKECHCNVDAKYHRPCPFTQDGGSDAK